jgi:type III restriction enzyme
MSGVYLQRMVENLPEGILPANWSGFDLANYSRDKRLWEYQQASLRNALMALWRYYNPSGETLRDFEDPKGLGKVLNQAYMAWYRDFGLDADLDIPLDRSSAAKRRVTSLLESYYESDESGDRLPYEQFINRMSFWMATGSGKTLVIVKLLEVLYELIRRGEIPAHDILILAHRDDLLEQLRSHIHEFNSGGGLFIKLHELREYAESKQANPSLFSGQEINVFYYRSDNLSDEQKEKIIDFRSYDNDGAWYVLLDEAHKGDKEDSKRQHIYSILSRNGFLFNFSATFTDERDIVTTVANFNLSEFIRKGHGKHISVLKQETRAFKNEEEYTPVEKQKIVLKALIMLAYIRQFEGRVRRVQADLYHRPLLMTLVNSVNTEDADLKLFFRELVRIGRGEVDQEIWTSAKAELLKELRAVPDFLYESEVKFRVDESSYRSLAKGDILRSVFNAEHPGEIEVLVRPSNNKEVAFKLKTSDDPFAIVRIGDISNWLKQELTGYEINQHFSDEGFFERLNAADSEINILLGSRSFYEGWDSNRPNVIMYINIGTGTDARKFILQSVGRGVRVEPLRNQRKRLRELYTGEALSEAERQVFGQIKDHIQPLESVFVFGTNREALNLVISELDQEDKKAGERTIALELNVEDITDKLLLIPTYRIGRTPLYQERELAKFSLAADNLDLLKRYLAYVDDDRVFLALHDVKPVQVQALRSSLEVPAEHYRTDGRPYKNLSVLTYQTLKYFTLLGKELAGFKVLEDEINHYKNITVRLEEYGKLEMSIQRVLDAKEKLKEAKEKVEAGQLSLDELIAVAAHYSESATMVAGHAGLEIRRIAHHYFVPVLISPEERIDYIRSVIQVESEVRFLRLLEEYVKGESNKLKDYDWWLFSRVDEKMDDINIPYYYPIENRIANFKPDFIFWLKKGNRYHILFVDPKGTGRTEYEHKVDGYRSLFEEGGKPKVFEYEGLEVSVHVFLYTPDRQFLAEGYKRYWFDQIDSVLESIV